MLSECRIYVLNEVSKWFTFHGSVGGSYINVIIANSLFKKRKAVRRFRRQFQQARRSNPANTVQVRVELSQYFKDFKRLLMKTKQDV